MYIVINMHGGGPLSPKKGVSYTNLMSSLDLTLKLDYYSYIKAMESTQYIMVKTFQWYVAWYEGDV
jgi:hypothetical protein